MTTFERINYNHDLHAYDLDGKALVSVTTLLSRIKPPFDSVTLSSKIAMREGQDRSNILKKWEKSAAQSQDRGTRLHQFIDDKLNNERDPILPLLNEHLPEMDAFTQAWDGMAKTLNAKILQREWLVGDEGLGVAGRIDSVIQTTVNGISRKHVFDWKTGKFYANSNFGHLLPPFDDLEDCHLNVYSLQTSLYRLIIERNVEPLHESYILHLRNDGTFHLWRSKDFRSRLAEWLKNGVPDIFQADIRLEKKVKRIINRLNGFDEQAIASLSLKTTKELGVSAAQLARNIQSHVKRLSQLKTE